MLSFFWVDSGARAWEVLVVRGSSGETLLGASLWWPPASGLGVCVRGPRVALAGLGGCDLGWAGRYCEVLRWGVPLVLLVMVPSAGCRLRGVLVSARFVAAAVVAGWRFLRRL